jgi:ABC-2 type transport system permease protein
MSALVMVEVRRLLSRRVVRFVAATAVFGMLLAGVVLFVRSHRTDLSPAEAAAKTRAALEQQIADCTQNIGPADVPPGLTPEQFCKRIAFEPTVHNPEFHLTHYREVSEALSGLFIAILVVLGATSVGAEWHAGTVTTQLTWEPRRAPLLLAKAVAAALVAFVGYWLAEAMLLGALTPAALFRGTTEGVDAHWLRLTAEPLLRASAVAAMGAMIGHGLAWLARNTAVAVGAVLGYAAVIEPLLRAVRPMWEPWFVVSNAVRFITAHRLDFATRQRSTAGAGVLLVAYTLGVALVSVAVFRRRDVT